MVTKRVESVTTATTAPDDLLSSAAARALLGVSAKTLNRYADAGKLPVIVLPSGHRRYRRADLDRLIAGNPA